MASQSASVALRWPRSACLTVEVCRDTGACGIAPNVVERFGTAWNGRWRDGICSKGVRPGD